MTSIQTWIAKNIGEFATTSIDPSSVFIGDVCRVVLASETWWHAQATSAQYVPHPVLVQGAMALFDDVTSLGGPWQAELLKEAWLCHVGRESASTVPWAAIPSADYWATELPLEIARWAASEDADVATPQDAARGLGETLSQAAAAAFLILYDLLSEQRRLSVAQARTLLRALARSEDPMVHRYRGRLLREALRHPSAAVRYAAALGIFDSGARSELPALREARDHETNRHVARSMTAILDTLA